MKFVNVDIELTAFDEIRKRVNKLVFKEIGRGMQLSSMNVFVLYR